MNMKNNGAQERFKNRKEALLWLQGRGQISQGKFYQDCAAGHLTIHPDKSLSKFQVAEYAIKFFSFARQEPSRNVAITCAGQGTTMKMAKRGDRGGKLSPFEDLHITARFETPEHVLEELETGRGVIRIDIALSLSFVGTLLGMTSTLRAITQDQFVSAISGMSVAILGEETMKGGIYVQG